MKQINIMEVCGTHTMSIAKAGIKGLLPESIKLISGPGCPVCVTPAEEIDAILKLSENKNIIIATYGDMIRVPGSIKGDNLYRRRAEGANVEIVYSPIDAVEIARKNPEREIVFLGVGFETTAPGTAAAIKAAREGKIGNFSEICMLKTIEPAIRKLQKDPDFNVQGFLCPGHVAVILGEAGFRFIPEELKIPAVIAGFEPAEIIKAITLLLKQIDAGEPKLQNAYKTAVTPTGNVLALEEMKKYFEPVDTLWRGLGLIENSGLKIRKEFEQFDAGVRYGIDVLKKHISNIEGNRNPAPHVYRTDGNVVHISKQTESKQKDDCMLITDRRETLCRCGEIICGKLSPKDCPMFGTVCTPEDPEGPCMVSSEGACAAAYKYQ